MAENGPDRIDSDRLWAIFTLRAPRLSPLRLQLLSQLVEQRPPPWLGRLDAASLFIEPGSPWENGYNESFNGKLRDELLSGEIVYTV